MGVFDFTKGGTGDVAWNWFNHFFVASKRLKPADMIQYDATLKAAGKITAGDVIKAIDMPARCVVLGSALETVTDGTAAGTLDIGIGGGDELQDGAALDGGAGAITLTLHGDDWGVDNLMGYAFTSADTIDATFKADETTGEFIVHIWGIRLPTPKASSPNYA